MFTRSFSIAAIAAVTVLGATSMLHAQPAGGRSVWDGVYSQAQADRGKATFMSTCARCHGDTLQGIDVAPALVGGAFMGDWTGQSVGDLVDRIHTTMPADNPGHLSTATSTDLTAFILSQNGIPAGSADLPHDAAVQSMIRMDASKPTGK